MGSASTDSGHLTRCPVVGIGTSAGGVKALQEFFEALPEGLNAAFVVIIHLDPNRESELAKILAGRTAMPVAQVVDGVKLEPNRVYVIPPNRRLLISDRDIATMEFNEPRSKRLPIDGFFRSMAEQRGDSMAVVLTGAGSDGATGIKAIREAGGVVLVQDPREAEYNSMPESAIATGFADFVLPVRQIAEKVDELLRSRQRLEKPNSGLDDEQIVGRILEHLQTSTGHDFSGYKRSTVLRRLARRMQITKSGRLEVYLNFIQENVEEAQALFGDLLISVTAFFRDPAAFDALARDVIPKLFNARSTDDGVRVWVPGCATGEEAYSIAMLLLEEQARHAHSNIQIFASDLDSGALATAREGRYPLAIEADVSQERLREFFVREADHYRVKRHLRDVVLFATHSLLKDPPFLRLDLVSCRNLLIYLDRSLQRQACNMLAYGLVPGGYLFLGSSEGIDNSLISFRTVDRQARIFQVTERSPMRMLELPKVDPTPVFQRASGHAPREDFGRFGDAEAHRQALEEHAPPSILVDDTYRAINLSENAGRYLLHPRGSVTSDVAEIVRPELKVDLYTGLHRAFNLNEPSLSSPVAVRFNGMAKLVQLQIRPVAPKDAQRSALVLFIEGGGVEQSSAEDAQPADVEQEAARTMRQLREELNSTRLQLRESRAQQSAAVDNLRAANEELQSTNEEYRSTAEELETSREELQSSNEELLTVNNELKSKLDNISRAQSDIENLIASTDVGTLFLDTELRIRRFTPHASSLFNIAPRDEGRLITDFTHRLEYQNLAADAQQVIDRLTPIEHVLRAQDGRWYLIRLRPYRTSENRIEGVVISLVEVTQLRQAEESLRASEQQLRDLIMALPAAVYTTDVQGRITFYNDAAVDLAGRRPQLGSDEWCVSWRLYHLDGSPLPQDQYPMAIALRENRPIRGVELIAERSDGTRVAIIPYPTPLRNAEGDVIGGVNMLIDISERREAEERQQILINELNHRVRNTLATVQAIANQTFQWSDANARQAFEARLLALSNAHGLLTRQSWEGAELHDVLARTLATQVAPERLHVEGPPVQLWPQATLAISLAMHELATNALKYGALSNGVGQVSVTWTLDGPKPGNLNLQWRESDGPVVGRPARKGFGSRLIERSLAHDLGGQVGIDYRPEGVVCTITCPLKLARRAE